MDNLAQNSIARRAKTTSSYLTQKAEKVFAYIGEGFSDPHAMA